MQLSTALTWSWLNVLTKKRYDMLCQAFGDLEKALGEIGEPMLRGLGCQEATVFGALNRLDEFDADAYAQLLGKQGMRLMSIEDDAYPAVLREMGDPPVFLYSKGSTEILSQPCIGCVGTREMSTYGKRVTELFTPAFVRAGMVTVSGLAEGIDASVARETLLAGGKTVAVLGHGLGAIYPKSNAKLAEEIVSSGGLLLTEFPLDCPPDKYTFPARNRIIAGLSLATVVLEAGEGSGAIITADLALEYGRDCFAVPGQIFDENYRGCHDLIASGRARLVSSPEEVLRELRIVAPDATRAAVEFVPADREEAAVWTALTSMPQSVSDLTERAKIDAAIINAKLTMLELSGSARNVGNGMWVRS
ncbi:DNA-protecting protein DprA [Candidatus Peregrinibacteria bacterium]|nr:DNA-protecting protein DprA [Candidatus Peregrinibacteria bacterium]